MTAPPPIEIPAQSPQLVPPGAEARMEPPPVFEDQLYFPTGKLAGKVAVITGGDSGIGRAVSILFAKEGAKVVLVYLKDKMDADATVNRIRELNGMVTPIAGDVGQREFCEKLVSEVVSTHGRIDILINNAGEQHPVKQLQDVQPTELMGTFITNIFALYYLTQAALPHMRAGAAIINTASIQAFDPSPELSPYACTKAAVVNFTHSLAKELADKDIRVNAVAPGPIWTPLITTTFEPQELKDFGKKTLFKRPGQPIEVAPAYLFLASPSDSSFITGQVIHVNGGQGMY